MIYKKVYNLIYKMLYNIWCDL